MGGKSVLRHAQGLVSASQASDDIEDSGLRRHGIQRSTHRLLISTGGRLIPARSTKLIYSGLRCYRPKAIINIHHVLIGRIFKLI